MSNVEKLYTVLILAAVSLGLLLGQISKIAAYAEVAIVPLLIAMLYVTFLQIPMKEIKQSFSKRSFTITSLIINFIVTPLVAWLLAMLFLDHPALWLGFIMLMVTPCTDWYIVFTGLAKGNVALSASILPLNLVLQLLLLPAYLYLFSGTAEIVNFSLVLESIVLVLVIPLVLAYVTRGMLVKDDRRRDALVEKLSSLPMIFLCLAIVAMFSSQGKLLINHLELFGQILIPIMLFFLIMFILGRLVGRMLKFTVADTVSLNLTTLARNSPIVLAIAMTAFPHEPLVALVLVIGPLIELPILSMIVFVIVKLNKHKLV